MACNLLSLPRELRDEIYVHLYAPSSNSIRLFVIHHSTRYSIAWFKIQGNLGQDLQTWTSALRDSTALLQTCKQLRHEATPFFSDSIHYSITIEGNSPGSIGFDLSSRQFQNLVVKMRRVTLTLRMKDIIYGRYPRLLSLQEILPPLKRNTEVLLGMLERNFRLKIETINLDLECRRHGGADAVAAALEGLGRQAGVKVYDRSRSREAVTKGCIRKLVEGLGGVDCTELVGAK